MSKDTILLAKAVIKVGEEVVAERGEPGNTCALFFFDNGDAFDTGHLRELVLRIEKLEEALEWYANCNEVTLGIAHAQENLPIESEFYKYPVKYEHGARARAALKGDK